MKSSKELLGKLKYGDFLILGTVLTVSALLFAFSFFPGEGLRAEISLDGEPYASVELQELEEERLIEVGSCRILLEKDGASFLSSACPDKLCVNRGKLKRAGDTMACMPEKVTVVLKSDSSDGFDAVVF